MTLAQCFLIRQTIMEKGGIPWDEWIIPVKEQYDSDYFIPSQDIRVRMRRLIQFQAVLKSCLTFDYSFVVTNSRGARCVAMEPQRRGWGADWKSQFDLCGAFMVLAVSWDGLVLFLEGCTWQSGGHPWSFIVSQLWLSETII